MSQHTVWGCRKIANKVPQRYFFTRFSLYCWKKCSHQLLSYSFGALFSFKTEGVDASGEVFFLTFWFLKWIEFPGAIRKVIEDVHQAYLNLPGPRDQACTLLGVWKITNVIFEINHLSIYVMITVNMNSSYACIFAEQIRKSKMHYRSGRAALVPLPWRHVPLIPFLLTCWKLKRLLKDICYIFMTAIDPELWSSTTRALQLCTCGRAINGTTAMAN